MHHCTIVRMFVSAIDHHTCLRVSLSADVYNGTGTNGRGRGTSDCYVERFVVLYEARLCFHFRYSAGFCLSDVNGL